MRDNYDFSDSIPNPYAEKLKKQITIRYFEELAEKKGIPWQNLINLYLKDCADSHRDLTIPKAM